MEYVWYRAMGIGNQHKPRDVTCFGTGNFLILWQLSIGCRIRVLVLDEARLSTLLCYNTFSLMNIPKSGKMWSWNERWRVTPPRQNCTEAEFTDTCLGLSARFALTKSIPSLLLSFPSSLSFFEMSAPSVPSKPQHSRHDTALIHGLSTSEVQALSEACIEAKERAYCKLREQPFL